MDRMIKSTFRSPYIRPEADNSPLITEELIMQSNTELIDDSGDELTWED